MAKIVLLGSETADSKSIQDWLLAEGHDVRVSQTGAEAIDLAYLFKPDLLITDRQLKCEYDGLEVAKAYRFANRSIKTILISDCSISEDTPANIFQSLVKPVSKATLLEVINQALSDNDVVSSGNQLTN